MTLLLAGLLVGLGSVGTVQKYLGTLAAAGYVIAAMVGTPLVLPPLVGGAQRHLTGRRGLAAAIALYLAVVVVFAVVYPHTNVHTPGHGSDRDDSIGLGSRALFHGRQPYGGRTYLGNPVDQGPTVFVLAAPFALVTSVGWQNVLWIGFVLVLFAGVASLGVAAVLLAAAFAAAPAVPRDFFTGGDLAFNPLYVAAAAWAAYEGSRRRWWAIGAVGLGAALGSRPNWGFVLIPLAVCITRDTGRRAAARVVALALATGATIYAPFVATAAGRTGLTVSNMLSQVGRMGELLTIAAAGALAVWLAMREVEWSPARLVWQVALVQGVFVVALIAHASAVAHRFDASPLVSGYGVPATMLVVLALAADRSWVRRPVGIVRLSRFAEP